MRKRGPGELTFEPVSATFDYIPACIVSFSRISCCFHIVQFHGRGVYMKLIRFILLGLIVFIGNAPVSAGWMGKGQHVFSGGDSIGYRTFKPESLALARDDRGRLGNFVKRKPVRVFFSISFRNTVIGATALHIDFNSPIDTARGIVMSRSARWFQADPRMTKWDIAFSTPLDGGDTVLITGYTKGANPVRINRYYWSVAGVRFDSRQVDYTIIRNDLKYPMPNRINALADAFMLGGFQPTKGLVVGISRYFDSTRSYGWLQAVTYLDVLKSLSDRSGLQSGWPRGFDYFTVIPSRPILSRQKYIPPARQNNKLLGGMIALKLNIVASSIGMTQPGFGELIFNDSTANPLNGLMVKEIAAKADSLMNGWYDTITHLHRWEPSSVFVNLSATIDSLNAAFEGPLDTVKFYDTLRFTPTRIVADVRYLFANPGAVPERIVPGDHRREEISPDRFSLLQNYPNPFNPTTTIEFNLPATSTVSLVVYNLLGQQVLTIYDHAVLEDGLYETEVNGANLASGIYFYHLVADEVNGGDAGQARHVSAVKKMILMK
jgi:hypothetical protein